MLITPQSEGRLVERMWSGKKNISTFGLFVCLLATPLFAAEGDDNICQSLGALGASYEKHTLGPAPGEAAPEFKAWIGNPQNWSPERREAHRRLVADYLDRVEGLSEELGSSPLAKKLGRPVLLLTRGNSGSGKSYLLKHPEHPLLEQLDLPRIMGDPRFAEASINPDILKHTIQSELEAGKASAGAVHEEGSMLADRVMEEAFERGWSFIVDKRFGRAAQIDKLARTAREKGYHVIVVDVDAPLSVSSARVTNRPLGGESPNVQFDPIRSGYVEARENRAAVAALPSVDDYISFSSTPHNPSTNGLVAFRSGSHPVQALKPEVWEQLTKVEDPEIRYAEVLYGEVLDLLSRAYPNEFARIVGVPALDQPEATPWNLPSHDYLVLPGDEALLRKVAEGKHATYRKGNVFTLKLGWGKADRYEVLEVGDALTLRNLRTGKQRKVSFEKMDRTPRRAHITEAELKDYAKTRGGSALMRLRDDRYNLVKYQDMEYHEKMAYAVKDYIERTIPGVKVRFEVESDRYRIFIENTDRPTKARLVADRNWAVKLVSGSNPESPALLIDTSDIERLNYPMISPRPDRGIGYNGAGRHTPGSVGHEFVTYGSQLDLLADIAGKPGRRVFPDAPPLFQVSRGSVGFVFSSWAENGKYFHSGFRSDQGVAFHHGARVHLHQAKQLQGKTEKREDAIREAKEALNSAQLADEFLGFTAFALKQADSRPQPIRAARPTSMDRRLKGQLNVDFHSRQIGFRAEGRGTVKESIDKAALWFEEKAKANAVLRTEAERLLRELGGEAELLKLREQWKAAQTYPDATSLYRHPE